MTTTATNRLIRSLLAGRWKVDQGFALFWTSGLISNFGSKMSLFAIPMTAILLLHATPAQMGYLYTAEILPAALFGVFAGHLADRYSKKRLLIIRDLGAGFSLLLIVIAHAASLLDMRLLFAILFVCGSFRVLGEVAEGAMLPEIVKHKNGLVRANSRLEASSSAVMLTGPGLSGWLIQLLSAPLVILCDVASYFVSALLIAVIPSAPSASREEKRPGSGLGSVVAGLREICRHRATCTLSGISLAFLFLFYMIISLRILRATEQLGIPADVLGVLYMLSGAGGLASSSFAEAALDRHGLKRVAGLSLVICGLGCGILAVLDPDSSWKIPGIGASLMITAIGLSLFLIAMRSAFQIIVPGNLLGRVRGANSFIGAIVTCFSGVVAGLLTEAMSVTTVIGISAIGLTAIGVVGAPFLPRLGPKIPESMQQQQ